MAGTLTVQNIEGPSSGANANKIIIPSGQTLDASGATLVPSAGGVMQVITVKAGINTFNSSSWTNVVSASITPSSTANKIYVQVCCPGYGGGEGKVTGKARVQRNTTTIRELASFWMRETSGSAKASSSSMLVLDSPSTTASVTYNAQVVRSNGSSNLHLDDVHNGDWVITLMEIAQ